MNIIGENFLGDAVGEMGRIATVQEQILGIITIHSRRVTDFDAPYILTEDGMAQELGISRAHVSTDVRKLIRAGKIEWRKSHVSLADGTQWFQKRRIYVLPESMSPKDLHDLHALADYACKMYSTQNCLKLASLITEGATRGKPR
jgi:biotin operon repressor